VVLKASRYPVNGEESSPVRISGLLLGCRPAAISRLIIAVVVWVSVNALAFRALAHISQEVRESQPSLANRDSSTSVRFPIWKGWIGGSLDHARPTSVGLCVPFGGVMSVFRAQFNAQTTTGMAESPFEA
jgi:hypothetical protein